MRIFILFFILNKVTKEQIENYVKRKNIYVKLAEKYFDYKLYHLTKNQTK